MTQRFNFRRVLYKQSYEGVNMWPPNKQALSKMDELPLGDKCF